MQAKRYDWTQFKARLKAREMSMQDWCKEHGFNIKTVSALVCDRYLYFCDYGPKSRAIIAQALKDGLIDEVSVEPLQELIQQAV